MKKRRREKGISVEIVRVTGTLAAKTLPSQVFCSKKQCPIHNIRGRHHHQKERVGSMIALAESALEVNTTRMRRRQTFANLLDLCSTQSPTSKDHVFFHS